MTSARRAWQPPSALKQPLRKLFSAAGYELVRLRRPESDFIVRLLERHDINVIADVGANQGQYALRMRTLGYRGVIHSFEPSTDAYALLSRHARHDDRWFTHQVALGASAGRAELAISADSVSSSLLEVAGAHVAVAPRSAVAYRESVDLVTLDESLPLPNGTHLWLKLDTQGFEDQVLAGARSTLSHVEVLQTELSIVECYSGQADYEDVFQAAHDAGLRLVYVEPGTQDLETGELLQFDGVFARPGKQ